MKKLSSVLKAVLLTGFIAIAAVGVMPTTSHAAAAAPGDITIICQNSPTICAVIDDVIVVIGRLRGIIFE